MKRERDRSRNGVSMGGTRKRRDIGSTKIGWANGEAQLCYEVIRDRCQMGRRPLERSLFEA